MSGSPRRKGGLGKDPERAEIRAAQPMAIDKDWGLPVAAGLAAAPPPPRRPGRHRRSGVLPGRKELRGC
ncbi:hypothetical protein GCM10010446_25000 [Streptomyces enissocaesilis]|uniref:Uncharacterized protein n=1 Tax=Streptomyces enissocaesilis TaxID=332589 RepID=A0ABP6JQ50_9ACTN